MRGEPTLAAPRVNLCRLADNERFVPSGHALYALQGRYLVSVRTRVSFSGTSLVSVSALSSTRRWC
jgi:hypothetical protein